MQGPWIQMLCYQPLPGSTAGEREAKAAEWTQRYEPQVTDSGEYPEYRFVWPGDEKP